MKTKIYFFGLIIGLSSCSGTQNESNAVQDTATEVTAWAEDIDCESGWEKFANAYFAICYPDTWTRNDSGTFGSELVLTSYETETLEDGRPFSQNINVMKQAEKDMLSNNIENLDAYASFNKEQIEIVLHQAKIRMFEKTELAGLPAYRNIMTANQNGADLYFQQYMFKEKSFYFVMTFTAPVEVSNDAIEVAEKIMTSLRINLE